MSDLDISKLSIREKDLPSKKQKEDVRDISYAQVDVISILKALEDHVIHGKDMTSTQVNAALALLKRVLPEARPSSKAEPEETLSHEQALKLLDDKNT